MSSKLSETWAENGHLAPSKSATSWSWTYPHIGKAAVLAAPRGYISDGLDSLYSNGSPLDGKKEGTGHIGEEG